MYYKNHDYTVWMKNSDGHVKYFIKYHSQSNTSIIEISKDVFDMYHKEFKKPMECQRNERRRHIDAVDIDSHVKTGGLFELPFEASSAARVDVYTALKSCTAVQRKRLILHHIQGYSFTEIARMEKCDEAAIRRSVSSAFKKLQKYFLGSPKST